MQVLLYSNQWTLFLATCICHVSRPAEEWQGAQNNILRHVSASTDWLSEQLDGKLFEHIHEIFALPTQLSVLEDLGFELRHLVSTDAMNNAGDENGLLDAQDEMAEYLGRTSVPLGTQRRVRTTWLWQGWSYKMHRLFKATTCKQTEERCLRDWHNYQCLKNAANKSQAMQILLGRSVLKWANAQQYVEVPD